MNSNLTNQPSPMTAIFQHHSPAPDRAPETSGVVIHWASVKIDVRDYAPLLTEAGFAFANQSGKHPMNHALQKTQATNTYARSSLISLTLTAIITTLHHAYGLGTYMLTPGAVIILLPSLLMLWYKRAGNKVALWAYGLLNAFVILGLGFGDGFLNHTVLFSKTLAYNILLPLHGGDPKTVEKVFSLLPPAPVDIFLESTGVLMFIVSLFALYFAYKFMQGAWKNDTLR